ncbi:FAD-dependent oxidoreductase [Stutzerimonas tarimensis]|uniref:FAD-dependent oxidoreductase n=1 Tax=Stutzerimonas tarimensis TaxID=1507735 RepID=A0ABV7T236_9GAMM
MPDSQTCDVLVIGSGAAGLAAAVTAAWHGQRVILAEKEPVFGGATAWSGGWMWVPGNPLARRAGIHEDPQQPRTFLKHAVGERYDSERVEAFLDHCGPMVAFFEQHTRLQFADGNGIPDIHGHLPGAGTQGHQVIAAPYDGCELGPLIRRLRTTMAETSFLGMPIMAGADLTAFLTMTRSPRSAVHVARRFGRHLYDLARHGRAMQLVNGTALVARLAKSAEELGVQLWESSPAQRLLMENGKVGGAVLGRPDGEVQVRAGAVILAAGGFPNDIARRKALFPRTPTGHEHLALPPLACNGEGINLGESAGGVLETDLASPVAWAPVSRLPMGHGRTGHFPHIIDRAKPGVIGVLANGKRFCNEADGYYDYVSAMVEAVPEGQPVESWLVCDHRCQRRFGLGFARPFPVPLGPVLRSGYLKRGRTLEALAQACGIDPTGLADTITAYNRHARHGEDPAFGRGSTLYNRKMGAPQALHDGPNPCVAPIEQGPFYAVKVEPGCFGTFAGLRTNGHAQVLNASGEPIVGLYAAGTDMASVMGGHYPSGGINLGPAMTFGYVAGRHAAGVSAAPLPTDQRPGVGG